MRILLVAATDPEIQPIVESLHQVSTQGPHMRRFALAGHEIDLLTTGVGMVATAVWCSRVLANGRYDLALNVGVCGSFDPSLAPGTVVHVVTDMLAELGAEDGPAFLTIEQLGLLGVDDFPFSGGRLVNGAPPANAALDALPRVSGITVNTVHGSEESIARAIDRFHPQVETMEGAAFMYACLIDGVRFAQVRAVSNVVERRNREAWKMADAIRALGATVTRMLESA